MPPDHTGAADEITYLEAVRSALADAMRDDDRVFLLGEDIGAFGGAFGATAGLLDEFGDERVLDTPIAEEGFVGAAIGAAWMGDRPVVELQFADFVTCPFDVIVTVAAKTHWRSGQEIPLPDERGCTRWPSRRGTSSPLPRSAREARSLRCRCQSSRGRFGWFPNA